MNKQRNPNASMFRQKAEHQLINNPPKQSAFIAEADMYKLIHELQVHQIELEMQNEELNIAREKAELAEEKYRELYDFAPIGYLSLSRAGKIVQLNFSASFMLGKDRSQLINSSLVFFISHDTKYHFNRLIDDVFNKGTIQTCEVIFEADAKAPIYVRMDGWISENSDVCLLTMINFTESKQAEIKLNRAKMVIQENEKKLQILANKS